MKRLRRNLFDDFGKLFGTHPLVQLLCCQVYFEATRSERNFHLITRRTILT
ncbi:MAG: hypothetical protein ACI92S_001924, partial [Planctomycetaceae bacterium]